MNTICQLLAIFTRKYWTCLCQIMFIVITIIVGSTASGIQLRQVAVAVSCGFWRGSCGIHANEVSVIVIGHCLRNLFYQRKVVKPGGICVFLIGTNHFDCGNGSAGLLRHNRKGCKLPVGDVGIHIFLKSHMSLVLKC